eukprot:scaffold140010_cov20-Prasinocladus_malaysianus.AAC.1
MPWSVCAPWLIISPGFSYPSHLSTVPVGCSVQTFKMHDMALGYEQTLQTLAYNSRARRVESCSNVLITLPWLVSRLLRSYRVRLWVPSWNSDAFASKLATFLEPNGL